MIFWFARPEECRVALQVADSRSQARYNSLAVRKASNSERAHLLSIAPPQSIIIYSIIIQRRRNAAHLSARLSRSLLLLSPLQVLRPSPPTTQSYHARTDTVPLVAPTPCGYAANIYTQELPTRQSVDNSPKIIDLVHLYAKHTHLYHTYRRQSVYCPILSLDIMISL